MRRCVLCGAAVPYDGPTILALHIGGRRNNGAAVSLRWCLPCAEADELHVAMATADAADDDDTFLAAYVAIVKRIHAEHPEQARERIDIRRDTTARGMTLRGWFWGLETYR